MLQGKRAKFYLIFDKRHVYPDENVGENTRTICENYALFSRAISSDRAHFSPFRRLFSRISRARAVTRVIR